MLVTAGIVATTMGMDTERSASIPLAVASAGSGTTVRPATLEPSELAPPDIARTTAPTPAGPTFFFDDATDALAERAAARLAAASATFVSGPPATVPPSSTRSVTGAAARGTTASDPAADPLDLDLALDTPALAALRERAAAPAGATEIDVVVGAGDTLSGILNEHGVRIEQMPSLLSDEVVVRHLSRLRIGQRFTISLTADGDFHALTARVGQDTRITVRRADDGFAIAAIDLPIEKERVVTSGTIEQSLYLAAEQANLKQSTIMALADIFQWELDFARDIRKGDQFAIVYDRLYREGRYIGDGDILAAEFERGGRTHRAIRFVGDDGSAGYYSPDGTSKRRTFTRHPVDVVRVTSKFDPNRLHPVLHQIRAHRGVDYGAPHGSPIRATADGIVRFSGTRSSYGKTVILQHGKRVKTLYAHMSRISDKSGVGRRVRQGDVIGYVGNTGRVTGTHLHYEFRVDDKHVDPLTVELPAAAPIAPEHRDALRALSDELVAQMHSVLPGAVPAVASNDLTTSLGGPGTAAGGASIISLER